jgi:hypothetical protein
MLKYFVQEVKIMNFFNPYMPTTQYQSSMQQYYPQQSTPSLPAQQILKVNGEESVRQVRMAPNSSALAMDTTAPIVWLLVSDGVGSVTSTPYDISEHKMNQRQSLEERILILEEKINELTKPHDEQNDRSDRKLKDKSVQSAPNRR